VIVSHILALEMLVMLVALKIKMAKEKENIDI
jgi:hypothetical protein